MVFVVLQATNNAVISVMGLFVTRTLGLDVVWAGITLGTAAALEVPALLLLGRLHRRLSSSTLITTGCLAGIAYYAAMTTTPGLALLLGLQVLNAWFFAVVAGVGLTVFQEVVPRPGLAAGLYTNTRRVGAIVSGPVIGLGSSSRLGYSGVFAVCAALTTAALLLTRVGPVRRPPP
jgi:SET family sugar efflux transporter-like MFS transporter